MWILRKGEKKMKFKKIKLKEICYNCKGEVDLITSIFVNYPWTLFTFIISLIIITGYIEGLNF